MVAKGKGKAGEPVSQPAVHATRSQTPGQTIEETLDEPIDLVDSGEAISESETQNLTTKEERQTLLDRIAQLEQQQRTQLNTQEQMAQLWSNISETLQKGRRRSDESSGDSGPELRIKNITQLPAFPTLQQRDQWLQDLDRAFRGAPRKFRRDSRKILFALEYMDEDLRTNWDRYLDEQPEELRDDLDDNFTRFSDWTLTLIKDAANREFMISNQLENARQREGQSPQEFHNYLDSLEKHFSRRPEKERTLFFFSKLRPELRSQMNLNTSELPDNRSQMISLATRYWDSLSRTRKRTADFLQPTSSKAQKGHRQSSPGNRNRIINPSRPRQYQPRDQPTPATGVNISGLKNPIGKDGKPLRCYNCNSEYHLRPACNKEVKVQSLAHRQGKDNRPRN